MQTHAALHRDDPVAHRRLPRPRGIAGAHHERLDGKGYPHGLTRRPIALETRIITTADIFDALTADRPYRAAMPVSKALAIMTDMVGTQIDARLLRGVEGGTRQRRQDAGRVTHSSWSLPDWNFAAPPLRVNRQRG